MTFLRSLFGPSRDEIWSRLATEVEGRFREGGWFESSKVEVDVGPWTVVLDTFTRSAGKSRTTYTRLRAPYVNPGRFRFQVSPQNFLSDLGRFFGMQDVAVGVPEFDAAWVVQGTDEARLRELFADEDLRALLRGAGPVSFEVRDDDGFFGRKFPQGVDELVLTTRGTVKDLARLKVFFALFAATLDRLVSMGAAERTDPGM